MPTKRPKIKAWERCEYCEKFVPKKYLSNHENICRVRRGLDPKPENLLEEKPENVLEARPGESIQDFLKRISRGKNNEHKEL